MFRRKVPLVKINLKGVAEEAGSLAALIERLITNARLEVDIQPRIRRKRPTLRVTARIVIEKE